MTHTTSGLPVVKGLSICFLIYLHYLQIYLFIQFITQIIKITELQRNSLYGAARIANFEGILGFSVPSIILVKAGLMQIAM